MSELPSAPSSRDRTVHLARGFEEADAWDVAQQRAMTPGERRAAARILKDRAYPPDAPDVREGPVTFRRLSTRSEASRPGSEFGSA